MNKFLRTWQGPPSVTRTALLFAAAATFAFFLLVAFGAL